MYIELFSRLVMYIERDCRRQAPGKLENQQPHSDYLAKCMELLIASLADLLPDITRKNIKSKYVVWYLVDWPTVHYI